MKVTTRNTVYEVDTANKRWRSMPKEGGQWTEWASFEAYGFMHNSLVLDNALNGKDIITSTVVSKEE